MSHVDFKKWSWPLSLKKIPCHQWSTLTFLVLGHPGRLVSQLCLILRILLATRADIITNFSRIFGPGSKFSAIGRRAGVSVEHWSLMWSQLDSTNIEVFFVGKQFNNYEIYSRLSSFCTPWGSNLRPWPGVKIKFTFIGTLDGGVPMSHVDFKKWSCPLSLRKIPCH